MAAPACAQLVMAIAMLAEGRWAFAMMMLPGLFGCIASVMLMRARQSATTRDDGPARRDDAAKPAMPQLAALPWREAMGFPATARAAWQHATLSWLRSVEAAAGRMPASQPATIGAGEHGSVVFDLAARGPHALVAGTTGSGKSVLLRQWCLSLAVRFPPSQLAMVFLDFKGGATFRDLQRLPHAVGCVSDLDLAHAVRALNAIERELKRREVLAAQAGVGQIDDMDDPPPRLLVVVDEYHALRDQLPDAVDRLGRLASLGRSLGMNLIACTQHPMGQVNAAMKANIALNVCLRVRDGLQSSDLLGSPIAAAIPADMPGFGYSSDGGEPCAFRCVGDADPGSIVEGVRAAAATADAAMLGGQGPLFSAPLPRSVPPMTPRSAEGSAAMLRIGLWDDGVMTHPCDLPWSPGDDIAVIGGRGRGKSTALACIARQLEAMRIPVFTSIDVLEDARRSKDADATGTAGTAPLVALLDDADDLMAAFSPASGPSLATLLADRTVSVIAAVHSGARHAMIARFATRIVLPTGDRSSDLMAGIPAPTLARMTDDDRRIAGRAVLVRQAEARIVQLCCG